MCGIGQSSLSEDNNVNRTHRANARCSAWPRKPAAITIVELENIDDTISANDREPFDVMPLFPDVSVFFSPSLKPIPRLEFRRKSLPHGASSSTL